MSRRDTAARKEDILQIIRDIDPVPFPVDLVHVTYAGRAVDILQGLCQIEATYCKVFRKHLVYFFVSRAAFKLDEDLSEDTNMSVFPAAFVVKSENLPPPTQIYPFDTGAAAGGIFRGVRFPGVVLEDYKLDPSMDSIRRYITWAFGDYESYVKLRLRSDVESGIDPAKFVAAACVKIAKLASSRENMPDTRAASVEVAYGDHVSLPNHLHVAIFPDRLAEREDVQRKISDGNLNMRFYPWVAGKRAKEYQDEMARLVTDSLRGLL